MKPLQLLSLSLFSSAALSNCSFESNESAEQLAEPRVAASESAEIEAMLHQHIAVLASDEFEGRAPATPGEEKTINYLQSEFEALGIGPGNGDSYFQSVSVTEITTANDCTAHLKTQNMLPTYLRQAIGRVLLATAFSLSRSQ